MIKRKNVSLRKRLAALTPGQKTNKIGVNILDIIMTQMGWKGGPNSKELDDDRLDCTYRKLRAIIDIQLKSRSLNEDNQNWDWIIFKKGKELDMDFYNTNYSFLFLVGIANTLSNLLGIPVGVPKDSDKFPQIALIPGKVVVKYFTEIKKNNRITLSLKKLLKGKYLYFNAYFGMANIRLILEETLKKQEEEEAHLESRRKWKEESSLENNTRCPWCFGPLK